METDINYWGQEIDGNKVASFSSDERRWVTKIKKLKALYPDEVTIRAMPENNDGCIYAFVPAAWVKVNPPRKVVLTEEQRRQRGEQLRAYRESSSGLTKNDEISSSTPDHEYLFNEMEDA